jgi:hypothetical protein
MLGTLAIVEAGVLKDLVCNGTALAGYFLELQTTLDFVATDGFVAQEHPSGPVPEALTLEPVEATLAFKSSV